ncbi:MAG TPA: sulfotransferase [Acidimicrobiales bacterium]|nr:sulfotransferase [Acidimicrobiales bacterium]
MAERQLALDIDQMLAEVSATVGLDDFGHPSFRDGLEQLVSSARAGAQLTALGEIVLDSTCRKALTNRLRVTDWCRHHPEVERQTVEAPLFILGLPRTGTTALSHLLAADRSNRSLLAWEANESIPPPERETYSSDPRFERARNEPAGVELINPDFKAIHYDPPDMPIECSVIMAQHFQSPTLSVLFNVKGYDDWMIAADATHTYRYHRQVLQVLQSHYPGRWQLKTPAHCWFLDALVDAYPDARFVMTHRDPVRVTGSVCSLARSLSGSFTDADHTAAIAAHWPELIATMLDRAGAFRERNGDGRFYDMAYDDLVRDPVGAVHGLYDHFAMAWNEPTEQSLRDHASLHRQNRFGEHTYTLEEFGLEAGAIRARLSDYLDRYGDYV